MKIINSTDKYRCNCVIWLRQRLPELPYGLWTLDDKKDIINSQTPVVGSGAMSKDGVWFTHNGKRVFSGHVALVVKIRGDIITIHEANYDRCKVTEREGTKSQLNIIGFFVPNHLTKPMDKTYYIKSELRNELKRLWSDFDHERSSHHKNMAERLNNYFDEEDNRVAKVKEVIKNNKTLQAKLTDVRAAYKKQIADLIEEQQRELELVKEDCKPLGDMTIKECIGKIIQIVKSKL